MASSAGFETPHRRRRERVRQRPLPRAPAALSASRRRHGERCPRAMPDHRPPGNCRSTAQRDSTLPEPRPRQRARSGSAIGQGCRRHRGEAMSPVQTVSAHRLPNPGTSSEQGVRSSWSSRHPILPPGRHVYSRSRVLFCGGIFRRSGRYGTAQPECTSECRPAQPPTMEDAENARREYDAPAGVTQ